MPRSTAPGGCCSPTRGTPPSPKSSTPPCSPPSPAPPAPASPPPRDPRRETPAPAPLRPEGPPPRPTPAPKAPHPRFALAGAGYFHAPRRALELTPFLVRQPAEAAVWKSLGDYDLA